MRVRSDVLSPLRRLIAAAFLLVCAPAFAQDVNKGEPGGVPGGQEFSSQLRGLDGKVLAHLPPRLRNDPQAVQEVGWLLLEAIATQTIAALGQDANHPAFLPSLNFHLGGQPNADATYRTADVDAKGSYRLRGELGSLRVLRLGLFGPPPADEHAAMTTPGRWAGCSSDPVPTTQLVSLATLCGALPAATPSVMPEERQRTLRDRRLALEQRPLW